MHRDAVAALAPELAADLLDEVVACLAPIDSVLGEVQPTQLLDVEPALGFDARAAAGPLSPPRPLPPPRGAGAPAQTTEPAWLPLAVQAEMVRRGELSALELTELYLDRIAALQPRLNAFITVTADLARTMSARCSGGRLGGVPLGMKDIIATAGVRTTAGSRLLAANVPGADAICWERLRSADAVLLGKLNTHEFAAGTTNENLNYGPARNPWDPSRVSGGSSGGSAVATAAALVAGALGTDTGGSVRIPAACCGIVGIKPTYGRVPRAGVVPLSWTLDHVGPLARTVRDAALLLDVVGDGRGTGDCEPAARAGASGGLRGWHVGVPRAWLATGIEPEITAAFETALSVLAGLGAEIVDVPMPSLASLITLNRTIVFAEATSWHAGFLRGRGGEYGANVRGRMEAGRFIPAVDYLLAQRLRAQACRQAAHAWRQADVLALPTLPIVAPPIGARAAAGELLRLTSPFNVLGTPAVSVPCGFGAAGMPAGLQVVAQPGADAHACYVAAAYEAATRWGDRRPPAAAIGRMRPGER